MGHDHAHTSQTNRARLSVAIGIVAAVLVVEVVGAWLTGSLALLADAGHMFSDLAGLIIALTATVVAARPATDRQTFGYQRAEVFGALLNGLILLGVAIAVVIGAVGRLVDAGGSEVRATPMLVVAVIGLLANVAALLLLRPAAGSSINMRGAYLEVLGDTLGSVAVIAAAGVILLTGFVQADAIASLIIAGMIAPRALVLLRDVVRVLSESVPADTDVAEIRRHLLETNGVVAVHDVHVWMITSGAHVFSAHVVVEPVVLGSGGSGALLDELSACLADHFDVDHSTFQLEPAEHAAHEENPHR
ncbi:cation transporter [Cryobacterium sp. TMT2-18-3]|uniref:cation diffusion facilitator family transporter n=1 Tax=unclassified Cryobacterium TaxID=2649013 RepID=UPI00106B2CE1|nr:MULTISPECIES: cation diffusion facilitator family transporter [unclassified Cryobacterium]TFC32151.1 cation transporter [Cryobacterium sp. TMT2-18-2]TFC56287.1 cation transporter [Cryobacterium sp. TMT2-15-1]TFC66134.1 cation transporter [Cryobacterium sp. TMT2-18-3]